MTTKLGERTRELALSDSNKSQENAEITERPTRKSSKKSNRKASNKDKDVDNPCKLGTLHEAFQFLMVKFVWNVEKQSDCPFEETYPVKKADAIMPIKARPVYTGDLLDIEAGVIHFSSYQIVKLSPLCFSKLNVLI